MKACSLYLRQRVLEAALSGDDTIAEVAELFGRWHDFRQQDALPAPRRRYDLRKSEYLSVVLPKWQLAFLYGRLSKSR